ncbi:MAG: WG repeat-containing protein, partial [Alistipes sp.]|nr:WG repeat-containing protein [Alistipes sp.]
LTDNRAHGDLKPDTLIFDNDGHLHLIDHDATYLPACRGMSSPELGTAAFKHPARTAADFNERLDDYPAALISTALHALALDPTLYDRYAERDVLLFDPRHIHHDEAYREALLLFEIHGLPYSYRIAQGLTRATWSQRDLIPIFAALTRDEVTMPHTLPQPYVELGRWGYGTIQGVVIPPVFDWACDFSEGLAAVRMGSHWHFIDPTGTVVLHCPPCKVVKPFTNGFSIIYDEERSYKMDKNGRLFDF